MHGGNGLDLSWTRQLLRGDTPAARQPCKAAVGELHRWMQTRGVRHGVNDLLLPLLLAALATVDRAVAYHDREAAAKLERACAVGLIDLVPQRAAVAAAEAARAAPP